jgi:anion-transporting  ArsA/GET3 family ATPase
MHDATTSPPVLGRQLVFVTGKGGVGKTTVAAALGLAAAARGRQAIVCELGGQAHLARTFGRTPPAGGTELRLAPRLSSLSIDPDAALMEWIARNVGRPAAALLGRSHAFGYLVAAAPGARELVTLGKAWDLTGAGAAGAPERLVIVDGPSSGHAVGLLQAPATFAELAPVGPVGGQAGEMRDFLADPSRSAIVLVATPEELPVAEALELATAIQRVTGRSPDAVVVDQVLPDRFDEDDLRRIDRALGSSPDPSLPEAAGLARRAWRRAREQSAHVAELRDRFAAPLVELPFLFVGAIGPDELRALAARLDDAPRFGAAARPVRKQPIPGVPTG